MTNITLLPAKWRMQVNFTKEPALINFELKDAAAELQAALPVWTKITDEPESRPAMGQEYLMIDVLQSKPFGSWFDKWDGNFPLQATIEEYQRGSVFWWRPLCDLDYPPEDS